MAQDVMDFGAARRWIVVGLIAVLPVAFWTGAINPFQLMKATVFVVGASTLVTFGVARIVTLGEIVVPRSGALYAAGAFAVAVVAVSITSEQLTVSVIGSYSRYAGALTYLGLVVLAATVIRTFDHATVPLLLRGALAGIGLAATYGLVQMLRLDPIEYQGTLRNEVVGSLGNPNIVSAATAIGVPLAIGEAIRTRSTRERLGFGVLAALLIVVLIGSGSLQGPVAVSAGLAVLALALVLRFVLGTRRRPAVGLWIGAAGVTTISAIVGLFERGPLGFIGAQSTFTSRVYYWEAAGSVFADAPLTGVGLGRFGTRYRQHRSVEAAVERPLDALADVVHNVPLSMFAEGGLLLGVTYLAFVVAVGVALVTGLRRLEGDSLLLLGAVGGAWVAYQVQSLVSFDVQPLSAFHWVLAGLVIVLARPPALSVYRLPWAGPVGKAARTRAARDRVKRRERFAGAVGMVVLVLLLVVGTRPLRADLAAADAITSSTVEQALDRIETAELLAPWEPSYPILEGRIHLQGNDPVAAQTAYAEAMDDDPSSLRAHLLSARLAAETGEVDLARSRYADALIAEPSAPALKAEIGEFELLHGDPDRAVDVLEHAIRLDGSHAGWWSQLGSSRLATGEVDGARAAFLRALDVDPSLGSAKDGLATIEEQSSKNP